MVYCYCSFLIKWAKRLNLQFGIEQHGYCAYFWINWKGIKSLVYMWMHLRILKCGRNKNVAFHLSPNHYLTSSLSYNCPLAGTWQNGIYLFYPVTKNFQETLHSFHTCPFLNGQLFFFLSTIAYTVSCSLSIKLPCLFCREWLMKNTNSSE